jgi:hypothetical protein
MRLLTQPRSCGYVAVSGDWRRSERNNVWPEAIQGVAANGISPEQAVDEAIARVKRDAERAVFGQAPGQLLAKAELPPALPKPACFNIFR